jgi:hypothetical protein
MMCPRAVLGLLFLAMIVGVASPVGAQYPVPLVPERPVAIEVAYRLFEAGHWPEAVEAFEVASREGPLPAEALLRWGVAASEAGRPLTALLRLSQFLAGNPSGSDRDMATERIRRAREALLTEAPRFSRLSVMVERRPDEDSPGERHLVRVAARDGEVSLEAMSGFRLESPLWRRAEEIPTPPYLELLRRLLDTPATFGDVPVQALEPAESGPRRAVALRLVIGDEERRIEAVRGEPYRRLNDVVDRVVEFARTVRPLFDPGARPVAAPAPPPKPGKKRR